MSRVPQMPWRYLGSAMVVAITLVCFLFELTNDTKLLLDATLPRTDAADKVEPSYVNPPPTAPAPSCTAKQRSKIGFQLQVPHDLNLHLKHIPLFNRSSWFRCPDPTWLERFYEEEINIGSERFLGISVGCNKGHDSIRTARMGLSSAEFDASEWRKALGSKMAQPGVCKQEFSAQPNVVFPKREGEMHCIEPMPSTFSGLEKASDRLNLDRQGLVLTNAAISSAQGTVRFPAAGLVEGSAGTEDVGINFCNAQGANSTKCQDVPAFSLEGYVDKYVTEKGPVNILQIDVEGWDFDVLFGASSVLDRTHYLEFEYHIKGKWNKLHLPDAVRLLDGKGFTCYWAAKKGRLWRITGCYFEFYNHWHGWSNVACVHRSQQRLSEKMERVFLETLKVPPRGFLETLTAWRGGDEKHSASSSAKSPWNTLGPK